MEVTVTNNMTLYDCLQQVCLEKYHDKLSECGIMDVQGLLSLTMQDYPSLGFTSMADRENLFRLIQTLKMTVKLSPQERHLCRESGMQSPEEKRLKAKEKMLGAKRPREATEKSPLAVKIKTRLDETKNSEASRLSSRSRSAESVTVTTAGFYDYGVPSIKPNHSPVKRHQSASDVCQSRIQVCVRKRPLSCAELDSNEEDVVIVSGRNTIELCAPKVAVDLTKYVQKYQFAFDEVFDEKCTNREVYDRTAKPLIGTVFNRGKATCFAYGCTGSGKTFTMLGNEDVKGIYILAASEIFSILHSGKHARDLGLWVSFYEIYCGQLFDLLDSRSRLFAREDANHQVCIAGLTEHQIQNIEELMEVIEFGGGIRSTGSTGVNTDSSRSHAILQLEIKNIHTQEQFGRFSFIDLAGCERAADVTDNDKQTRLEGAEINQSLLALKECIRALDLDSRHTPFRQSKLTQVLKDSFVGNSQTCMIANISPNKSCSENTLNTLRYADRVKELKKHMPGTPSPRPSTVSTSTYQGIEKLSPGKIPASIRKVNSVPKLDIQPVKLKESPCGQPKSSLKRLKMTDINQNIQPVTSNTQTLPLTRTKNHTSTKSSGTGVSVDIHSSVMRSNDRKRLIPGESQRPRTSPQVMTIQSDTVDNRVQTRLRYSKCKPQSTLKSSCLLEIANKERQQGHGVERTKDHTTEELDLTESLHLCSGDKLHVVSVQSDSSRNVSTNHESAVDKGSLGPNGPSPPSRNNRYGTAIKTRLAKLFDKGNIEDRSGGIKPKDSDLVHIPTAVSNQGEGCLSLAQEQLVASHHTQLAIVTGLCQEEMVLLKQINNGQKDFEDYIAHLDDILTRKVTCIESLREKLPRFPAHINSESSGKTGGKVYHQAVGRTKDKK